MDSGELKVVGVNCFREEDKVPVELLRISADLEQAQAERLKAYRAKRSETATLDAIRQLKDGIQSGANLQDLILQAVKAQATLGEIADAMRAQFGLYQEYVGF
jgi:methylmalonyl-CoA mutase N-terminal domain/subunit